jgi:hypothetical protein
VNIRRTFNPPKSTGGNTVLTSRHVVTSYAPYFKGDVSTGDEVIGTKRAPEQEIVPFNLNQIYAPPISDFCASSGKAILITPEQAENWYNNLDARDIATTSKMSKPLVKPTAEPDADHELRVGKPEFINPFSATFDLVRQKKGNKNQQNFVMSFNVVCGPGAYSDINLDFAILDAKEVEDGELPESLKLSSFNDRKGKAENSLEVWFMRTDSGQNKKILTLAPEEAPQRKEFCNGEQPVILNNAQAVQWYERMNAMMKRNGLSR